MIAIDYRKIVDALNFYQWAGFDYLEVPWFVSRQAINVTAPPGKRSCTSFLGDLVASGEQSFIQMWMDRKLKKGRWHCVTPCFRDESVVDELHLNYFLKVELIEVDPDNVDLSIDEMINWARKFFFSYVDTNVVDTNIGKDIVSSCGIELGSYGHREHEGFRWVYGTGLAEPRLSYVEQLGEINDKL